MKILGYPLGEIRKALYAFVASVAPPLYLALGADGPDGRGISATEWVVIVAAAFGVSGGVFAIRNAKAKATDAEPGP